jgi:hypothetical protein
MTTPITTMMRQAGMTFHLGQPHNKVVEQLARLVAIAVTEERAACIKACEDVNYPHHENASGAIDACIKAIDARSTA